MSLLDKASLIVTPNAYKASKLYSVVPNTTLGDMTVVRATTATRVNASGLIESVAVNVPRIDYTNGSCPSLLVEPQRTNLVFPSATLTTQTRTVTAAPNTLSFYGTGTIVLSGVHIATLTGTGANNRVSLTFTPTAGSLILTVTGTVTNAQLELGSYATSYIPTVASSVTRNADIISNNNLISKGLIVNDYVLFLDITNPILGSQYILDSTDISSIRTGILRVDGTTASITDITGGISISILNILTIGKGKMCVKRTGSTISFFANGVKAASTTTTTVGTINNLKTGVTNSTTSSYINSVVLFPIALTDTECINLTTL